MKMNERQAMAFAAMMAELVKLPWDERARVFSEVEYNDSICVRCGRATEQYGCHCQNDE